MLHYLDDMDSKIQGMQSILERDSSIEGNWTGYLAQLGRPLLKVQKFLYETEAASVANLPNIDADTGENTSEPAGDETRSKTEE